MKSFLLKGVAPLLGGLTLAAVFVRLVIDTADPEYGSGGSIFGLGTVFVLGVGVLALGAVVMVFWQLRAPGSSAARCSSATRPRWSSRSEGPRRPAAARVRGGRPQGDYGLVVARVNVSVLL